MGWRMGWEQDVRCDGILTDCEDKILQKMFLYKAIIFHLWRAMCIDTMVLSFL